MIFQIQVLKAIFGKLILLVTGGSTKEPVGLILETILVQQVLTEPKDLKDPKDQPELTEHKDLKDLKAQPELPELKDHKVLKVIQEIPDQRVQKGLRENLEFRVSLEVLKLELQLL